MSLKELVSQLNELEAEANISIEDVDQRVRVGAEGRQRAAKDQLVQLRRNYLKELPGALFIIAVAGPNSEEFAKIAQEKFGTVSVDHQALPKRLYAKLQERRASDMYSQNEHWMMLTELNMFKLEHEVLSMASPGFSSFSPFYQKPLYEAIQIMLKTTYGRQLDTIALRKLIGAAALERKFDGKKLPVVVYNFPEVKEDGLDPLILPTPIILLHTNGDVTEDSVKNGLLKAKAILKPRAKAKTEAEVLASSPEMSQDETAEDFSEETQDE